MHDIDRLLADLQSLYWWLTAGVFAVLVNLLSGYLKAPIDQWLQKRSAVRRAKLDKHLKETQIWAKFLLQDQRLLHIAETELISLRLKVATFLVLLTGEVAVIYAFASAPETIGGKVLAAFLAAALAAQALALLWGAREAELISGRLDYVRHMLEERILGPEPPATEHAAE